LIYFSAFSSDFTDLTVSKKSSAKRREWLKAGQGGVLGRGRKLLSYQLGGWGTQWGLGQSRSHQEFLRAS